MAVPFRKIHWTASRCAIVQEFVSQSQKRKRNRISMQLPPVTEITKLLQNSAKLTVLLFSCFLCITRKKITNLKSIYNLCARSLCNISLELFQRFLLKKKEKDKLLRFSWTISSLGHAIPVKKIIRTNEKLQRWFTLTLRFVTNFSNL